MDHAYGLDFHALTHSSVAAAELRASNWTEQDYASWSFLQKRKRTKAENDKFCKDLGRLP